jgi:hypothetical protein
MSSHRGLRIIESMRALVSSSGSILVLLPLCFKLQILYYLCIFCNLRTHVITLYLGHVCVVLCINASVLITCMDSV